MAYVFLSFALVIVALLLLYLRNHYSYWTRRGIPQEEPLYGFGNAKGIGSKYHFRDLNQRIYKRFKGSSPLCGFYIFIARAALILDIELVKNILIKDFGSFHDRGVFNNVRDDPLTGHLFTIEGEQWRSLRQKLTPVFTSGKMKYMFPTVVQVGESLASTCGALAHDNTQQEVEIKELTARFTTDVIGTCAFGIDCNSLADPNAEFREKGRAIFGDPRHSQVVRSFIITNPKLARKLRMKFFPEHVSEFFISAVRNTVEQRLKQNIKRNDFMDMLIEMMAKDQQAEATNDGIDLSKGLTLLQMAAQAFVFFVAGFDTSSTTMSFCLYELAINQNIQQQLREEIENVLAKYDNKVTYEAMNEMTYLDKVVAETLRKYTVLPHLVRKANADYQVPGSKLVIEKGTMVLIPIDSIHHDPEYYPDPEKFDPHRFDEEAVQQRPSCAYLPFGDGPRNCIGLRFGKMQTKIGLISLLREYKFCKSASTEVPIKLSKKNFIIAAENGIYLRVERIK